MFVHRLTSEKLRGKARFANNAPEQDAISSRRPLSDFPIFLRGRSHENSSCRIKLTVVVSYI